DVRRRRERRRALHFSQRRIVDLGGGQGDDLVAYLVDRTMVRRRASRRPDLNQLERSLVLSVEAEEPVDVCIHEAGEQARCQTEDVSRGRDVREHRAGVPVEVAPATRLVLPRVPPEEPGEHEGGGAPGEVGFAGSRSERGPYVAVAESPQREISR